MFPIGEKLSTVPGGRQGNLSFLHFWSQHYCFTVFERDNFVKLARVCASQGRLNHFQVLKNTKISTNSTCEILKPVSISISTKIVSIFFSIY